MHVQMVQHTVGQGGLFSGTISTGEKPFRWVYDCGSDQYDALKREISEVASAGDIDMLFLSHLDSDHVNGVDLLLTQCRIKEVIIPYIEAIDFIAILAKDASHGTLTTTFIDFVSDTPGWFSRRGVERVTQVAAESDEDEGEPPFIRPGDEGWYGDVEPKWLPDWEPTLPSDQNAASSSLVGKVAAKAAVTLACSGRLLNWVLIPHVHTPPKLKVLAFEQALSHHFGNKTTKKDITDAARTPQGRQNLRQCYDCLWRNHNLISMTLYTGPLAQHHGTTQINDWWVPMPDLQGGWLLTGDADLKGDRRRKKFIERYQNILPLVNVFMTPHHGSVHNFDPTILKSMPELAVGYAATGPNTYGHPHRDVQSAFDRRLQSRFQKVGLNMRSRLELKTDL